MIYLDYAATSPVRREVLDAMLPYLTQQFGNADSLHALGRQAALALRAARDKKYAKILSRATGYPLAEAADSAGGYKDWCVERLRIPAFTVEAGRESFVHPLGLSSLADIVTKNIDALAALSMGFS